MLGCRPYELGIASIFGDGDLFTASRGLTNESDRRKSELGVPFLINETLVSD